MITTDALSIGMIIAIIAPSVILIITLISVALVRRSKRTQQLHQLNQIPSDSSLETGAGGECGCGTKESREEYLEDGHPAETTMLNTTNIPTITNIGTDGKPELPAEPVKAKKPLLRDTTPAKPAKRSVNLDSRERYEMDDETGLEMGMSATILNVAELMPVVEYYNKEA
jgi:hypothetical protein